MELIKKTSTWKKIQNELINTTDTLWDNEVKANLFVARILIYTAILDLIFIIIAKLGVITVENKVVNGGLVQSLFELLIAAFVCLHLKGEKRWLKIVMLVVYLTVLTRVQVILNHNVVLLMVFPVVLSIRYYSEIVTSFIALLTTLGSGIAAYFTTALGFGRVDLNMVTVPAGTTMHANQDILLRDLLTSSTTINNAVLWQRTLRHSYLPKLLLFSMIAIISVEIAKRGREAILAQKEETQKAERIATELNLASDIQGSMLPNIFPAFPDRKEFDIFASMNPAKEVGGDFYDFFMVDEDHLAMVIADVSGKGIPAALFMVIAKTLIKDHTQLGLSPGEVFTKVNQILCEGNDAELFVTAWMGLLDLRTGEMKFANAGHNPPIIQINNEIKFLTSKPGFVLAGLENVKYKEFELTLSKGDKLFLYTDGATEATNKDKELFGEKRLIDSFARLKDDGCKAILDGVKADIDEFVGEAEQFDDLTLLSFELKD